MDTYTIRIDHHVHEIETWIETIWLPGSGIPYRQTEYQSQWFYRGYLPITNMFLGGPHPLQSAIALAHGDAAILPILTLFTSVAVSKRQYRQMRSYLNALQTNHVAIITPSKELIRKGIIVLTLEDTILVTEHLTFDYLAEWLDTNLVKHLTIFGRALPDISDILGQWIYQWNQTGRAINISDVFHFQTTP